MLGAGWAALAGVLPTAAVAVIGWFATAGGTATWALRIGADAWLLAHRVPVELATGRVSLVPLGLTLVPVILLCRAGAWVGRTCEVGRIRHAASGVAVLALAYGAFAAFVALLARATGATPDLLHAFVQAGALAAVAGGAGILRMSGHGAGIWRALPEDVRAALHGGLAGLVALFSAGALLAAGALAWHADRLTSLVGGLAPGLVGALLLLLVSLAYVPNAALCAAAFALGPGFAMGTGTVVSPTGVALGPLPAFPLLAGLPAEAPPGWVLGVLVIPIGAGVVSGLAAVRRFPAYGIDTSALRGGLAGVVAGLLFTGCAALVAGSLGPGRMADVGPLVPSVGIAAVSTLGVSGAAGVLASYAWTWLRSRQPERRGSEP